MRRYRYSSDDIVIHVGVNPNSKVSLIFRNGDVPSINLINEGHRDVFCLVEILHPYNDNNVLATVRFLPDVPAPYFHVLDFYLSTGGMVSAEDPLYLTVWGSLTESVIEIPLLAQPVFPTFPELSSRYRITVKGPKASEVGKALSSGPSDNGLLASWVMTFLNDFMWNLLTLKPDKIASSDTNLRLFIVKLLAGSVIQLIQAEYTAGNRDAAFLSIMAAQLYELLKRTDFEKLIRDYLGQEAVDEIATITLGEWLAALAAVNLIIGAADLILLDGEEQFIVDVPRRRGPKWLAATPQLGLTVGNRTTWALQVTLPDQTAISFTEDSFGALVTQVTEETKYVFENITVMDQGVAKALPLRLTLEADNPCISIRPVGVPITDPQTAQGFAGLGQFIQGQSDGQATIKATIEWTDTTTFLQFQDSYDILTVQVTVGPAALTVKWDSSSIGVETGDIFSLYLSIGLAPWFDFRTDQDCFGRVTLAPDGSSLELSDIALPSGLGIPVTLLVTLAGVNANGDGLVKFVPNPSLAAWSEVDQVFLSGGLAKVARAFHVGNATAIATVTIDPEVLGGIPPPADVTVNISVSAGQAQFVVFPLFVIEDTLIGDFPITVQAGDNLTFNSGLQPLAADMTIGATTIGLANINFDFDSSPPKSLPIDVQLAMEGNGIIEFTPESLFPSGRSQSRYYGLMSSFIKLLSPGDAVVSLNGNRRVDADVDVQVPTLVTVTIRVPEPVKLTLQSYQEPGANPVTMTPTIELWRHNEVVINGHIDNISPKTEVYGAVNGTAIPSDRFSVSSSGDFTVSLTSLPAGSSVVQISASKAINTITGGPSTASFTITSIRPIMNIDPLPNPTGQLKHTIHVTGSYCSKPLIITYRNSNGIGGTLGPYSPQADGSFDVTVFPVYTYLGLNTVRFDTGNGFEDVTDNRSIFGSLPNILITHVAGEAVPSAAPTDNGHPNITSPTVEIYAGGMQQMLGTLALATGALVLEDSTSRGGIVPGSWKISIPFDTYGTHTVIVQATNELGQASFTVPISYPEPLYDLDFTITTETSAGFVAIRAEWPNGVWSYPPALSLHVYCPRLKWNEWPTLWFYPSPTNDIYGLLQADGTITEVRGAQLRTYKVVLAVNPSFLSPPGGISVGATPIGPYNPNFVYFLSAVVHWTFAGDGSDSGYTYGN